MKKTEKQIRGEGFFIGLLLIFSVVTLILAYQISGFSSVSSPGSFPMFSSAVMVISIVGVILQFRKKEKSEKKGFWEEIRLAAKAILPPVFLGYTALIILYMILIIPLTFLPASFGFLVLSMILLKGGSPVKSLLISGGTIGIIYLVFHYLFRVVLP